MVKKGMVTMIMRHNSVMKSVSAAMWNASAGGLMAGSLNDAQQQAGVGASPGAADARLALPTMRRLRMILTYFRPAALRIGSWVQ